MEDSDSREEDVGNLYVEPGVQEKPIKADHGNVRKSPKGVGNGLSDPTRRRVTLQFKREAQRISKKYKLEMLVGIHSPTKVKKSWHFEAYGERMKEFVNFSATGKKMKTDMKLLSICVMMKSINKRKMKPQLRLLNP
ncbi:hypothetical protein DAPPUDRAFT_317197 [Daphnia pulex]|uniref:Uncharacterized protein n=1 Tax=Daphnia pulex TaxID=6669 RepID=E9GF79_DAPPU|nr:hypothetical protein DAPPUDRAFT_317197 [Daphnia pulex]|eukprot:EFX81856.1 hypothetical protein DAPPUDRAFT_317197 [Daphnia pulex]